MANPIQLTPAEIAEYENAAGPAAPAAINPLRDFSADELFDLSIKDKDNFDLVGEFRRNKDLWKDPNTVQKVAEVHSRIKDRGFELEDIPGPGKIARTVFDIAKGFGKQAWNYANALVGVPIAGAIGEITGDASRPGFHTELAQEGQRRVMENLAGTESAAFGVARLAEKGIGKVRRAFVDQTPEEKLSDLWKDVGSGEAEEEILKGKGGLLEPLGSEVRKELEAAGKPIRLEETAQLAAGDPLSFYIFGKVFQGAGKGIRAGAAKVAERLPAKAVEVAAKVPAVAEKAAETVGGRTIQAAGTLTELGGKAIKIAAPAVGMVKGAIEAGPVGALAGLKGGEIAAKIGGKISKGGKALAEAGKEIAGAVPVTGGVTQLTKDVIGSVPMAATEVGKGLAFDIGTAALTSETPRDTESVGIGVFFGGMGAARRAGSRIISGQLVGPRAWGSDKVVPSSGQLPGLDAMHADAIQNATPAVQTRLNAIRQFLKGSHADTDVFLAKDAPSLENTLTQMGLSPEQARQFSQTEGFFVTDLPGANGQPRRVIIARNVDAAPHESFHAIQDVLGETANQAIDQIVREEYGPQWEAEGQRYASRIGEGDWREVVLDATGTGLNYAKEKIAMDVANEYRAATGAEPPSGFVQERVKAILGQVMDRAVQANPNVQPNDIATRVWRDILSPQEATAVADSYLARELAAENFDVVFKHGGPDLQNVSGLTGRLARIVAQLVSTLGGEPLSPERVSQIGRVAPRFRVTEAVREAPGLVEPRPTAPPSGKPEVSFPPPGPLPPTPPAPPAEPPAVEEARKIAAEAPETPTVTGTASPREILGNVAEAIAQQAGLKVNYLSAVGEGPAAAITSNREARRAVIEAFRTMPPEARALWEKNFFPDRVVKLKGNKYQILGWAPEVFAANAHKLAVKLQELGVAEASPYPVKEGTFTPEGWQELFKDTWIFVQNQMGGRTGAGEPLVVPREITERGFFAPPVKSRAEALPQLKADFISMLFGIKLPDTARIQKGRLPLNIAGQAVSEATKPGRTEIPVIPRGRFEGVEAERQGIAGRGIMEVNPLRQQIEAAAQAKGVAMPEFIEAQQRLNLENIKNVEVAPELPEFRGNVLTLSAGFQPKADEPRAVKSAAVRFRNGKVFEGFTHADAMDNALREGMFKGIESYEALNSLSPEEFAKFFRTIEDGFVTNANEFLTHEQAFTRAQELKQIPEKRDPESTGPGALESFKFESVRRFQPKGSEQQAKDVAKMSPEEFRGNTLTLSAGFQPSAEPRAVKSAAVKDERGKVWEGFWHGDAEQNARVAGAEGPFSDGFTTNAGEFLTRTDALTRAKEMNQIPTEEKPGAMDEKNRPGLETSQLIQQKWDSLTPQAKKHIQETAESYEGTGPFGSYGTVMRVFAEGTAKQIAGMSSEQFSEWATGLPRQGIAGFTQVAHEVGLTAPSREFVYTLSIAQKAFSAKAEEAMKAGDFEKAMILASQSQFFREAWEAATGEGSAGFFFREKNPNFQPKFPLDRTATTEDIAGQMQPEDKRAIKWPAVRFIDEKGETFLYSAPRHAEAEQKLTDALGYVPHYDQIEDGFVTYGGAFLNREAAYKRAVETGQYNKRSGSTKNLIAEETSGMASRDMGAQLQPKKELKLKPAGRDGISKVWVLPNGKIVNIGGQWHHEFINDNPELRKQYKLSADTSEDNRVEAINKGFVRMNWDYNSGKLNIEARTKDWPKQREAVRHFVEANADKIDRMEVVLLSGKDLGKVDDANEVSVFTMEDNEKAAMLPFSDLGEKRETGQASERLFEKAASKAQFQPTGDKEKIVIAAVQFPSGRVVKGNTHEEALWQAENSGIEDAPESKGFVTSSGRFVNRFEAMKLAKEAGQITEGDLINPNARALHTLEFNTRMEVREPRDSELSDLVKPRNLRD